MNMHEPESHAPAAKQDAPAPAPKPATTQTAPSRPTAWDTLISDELAWWPYRSVANAMLQSRDSFCSLLDVHRKFADQMREIVRREQDNALELSEKLVNRITSAHGNGAASAMSADLEQIYGTAVKSMRELGRAVADVQMRSLEALRPSGKQGTSETAAPAKAA